MSSCILIIYNFLFTCLFLKSLSISPFKCNKSNSFFIVSFVHMRIKASIRVDIFTPTSSAFILVELYKISGQDGNMALAVELFLSWQLMDWKTSGRTGEGYESYAICHLHIKIKSLAWTSFERWCGQWIQCEVGSLCVGLTRWYIFLRAIICVVVIDI